MEMTCVSTSVKTVEVRIRRKYVNNSLDFTAMSWISDDQMTQNTSMRHKIKAPDETAEINLIRRKTPGLTQILNSLINRALNNGSKVTSRFGGRDSFR